MKIVRESNVKQSARVLQLNSMFDLPVTEINRVEWDVDLTLDFDWNIGLIVGPSGCGKTTIARELFGDNIIESFDWDKNNSLLDDFPKGIKIQDLTSLLGSVGFNSPPNWLRPFHVLSNGEQFRTTIARCLAECPDLAVVDEFTSVVDRQVAKVASHSVQKAVRKRKQKFVAIACHEDIEEWLQPDWVYRPESGEFQRGCLRPRPQLKIEVRKAEKALWETFSRYHYLSGSLLSAAHCFAAYLGDRPIGFVAYRHLVHGKTKNIKMGHRLVIHPDYQGLGLGGMLDNWLGQYLYDRGYRYHNVTAHPAMINFYLRSPRWKKLRSGVGSAGGNKVTAPKQGKNAGKRDVVTAIKNNQRKLSSQRSTYSFCYVPPNTPYENIHFS